jgi:hypothetical protein
MVILLSLLAQVFLQHVQVQGAEAKQCVTDFMPTIVVMVAMLLIVVYREIYALDMDVMVQ